uniref:large subunit GTPase 1 homolog n=1 Tax=Myxine glutinosa TaxID=7769 RepID=UPI00358EF54F
MGKKKQQVMSLGRAIIKDRNFTTRNQRKTDSWLHTSELNDGSDLDRLNPASITEQSSMDDFLLTAQLAGADFTAEKLNVKVLSTGVDTGLPSYEETQQILKAQEENKQFLSVPRRPMWNAEMTAEELAQEERASFLQWRRQLSRLQEKENLTLTPFEKNLDFWRQLWRVIERSDIVVQIVDARNPLLFRCEDLELYVNEVSPEKENLVLLNKADLLSPTQRQAWARFFESIGVRAAFWSALAECDRLDQLDKGKNDDEDEIANKDGQGDDIISDGEKTEEDFYSDFEIVGESNEEDDWETCDEPEDYASGIPCNEGNPSVQTLDSNDGEKQQSGAGCCPRVHNSHQLLHRDELLRLLRSLHKGRKFKEGQTTVGLVGYPNVGKSSTINTILRNKKVPVSATPGRTKHFQTLYVDAKMCLCDCPGLVMPSFLSNKAEMVCSGILPIDQMRDHLPPVSLACQRIPHHVLESTYGIFLPAPHEGEDPNRPPTSEELLCAYGYMRGYMTTHGQPDQPRSARYILKDYVNGKLLYCHPPPDIDPKDFQPEQNKLPDQFPDPNMDTTCNNVPGKQMPKQRAKMAMSEVDRNFFQQSNVRALTKGVQRTLGYPSGTGVGTSGSAETVQQLGKPWKKHGNRNTKEKARRLYKYLDN